MIPTVWTRLQRELWASCFQETLLHWWLTTSGSNHWKMISCDLYKIVSHAANQSIATFAQDELNACSYLRWSYTHCRNSIMNLRHATILVISKACHQRPLPNLPTAMDTAEVIFQEISHHYGIPEDIVCKGGVAFPHITAFLLWPLSCLSKLLSFHLLWLIMYWLLPTW